MLALLVFGPKELPEIARQIGKALAELKGASNEFQWHLEEEMRKLKCEPDNNNAIGSATSPNNCQGEYVDVGESGTKDSRPHLNELMAAARKRAVYYRPTTIAVDFNVIVPAAIIISGARAKNLAKFTGCNRLLPIGHVMGRELRKIPFHEELAQALRRHQDAALRRGPEDFVFAKADGTPLHPDVLGKDVLYPVLDRLGIPRSRRNSGFHCFRHSAGSIVAAETKTSS